MQLTTSQKQAVKAWVQTNNASLFDQSSVDLLNAVASPSYRVWKLSLGKHDLIELPDKDSDDTTETTFALGGGTGSYVDRSQGERDGWRELFNSVLFCKPYLANVRVAFFDIFSGAAALAAKNRKHFWARGQRPATVLEKLLAVVTVGGPVHSATNGNSPAGQSGARGTWTNPDTFGTGADGLPVEGPITLDQVIESEAA
jgi:hypothetical protein